jgi:hypothetical protein
MSTFLLRNRAGLAGRARYDGQVQAPHCWDPRGPQLCGESLWENMGTYGNIWENSDLKLGIF